MREWGAPERLLAEYRRILEPAGMAEELGLSPQVSDLDLAPTNKLRCYLILLYT